MNRARIRVEVDGAARPSEIIADLRTAAETLYFPMRVVGFWDHARDLHLCPHEERRQECPHLIPEGQPGRVDYVTSLQRERQANLEVYFEHADVSMYMR